MKILAIDTSGPNCSVAITDDGKLIADFTVDNDITHSQNLIPMIEQVQKFTNIELSDIDAFACSVGPGSFTGLRIGIATTKGFALSLNKPVLSVPSLLGLAYNVTNFNGIICSIIDAKNHNVYAGIYMRNLYGDSVKSVIKKTKFNKNYEINNVQLVESYISDSIYYLIKRLKDYDGDIMFIGDGVNTYKELLLCELQSSYLNIHFAPPHLNSQQASSIARAALDMALNDEYTDYNSLTPLYLKKSQAERELDAKRNNNL